MPVSSASGIVQSNRNVTDIAPGPTIGMLGFNRLDRNETADCVQQYHPKPNQPISMMFQFLKDTFAVFTGSKVTESVEKWECYLLLTTFTDVQITITEICG